MQQTSIRRLALVTLLVATAGPTAFAQAPAAPAAAPAASPTLAAVKARGVLNCGVIGSSPNFSLPDSTGVMRGLDADLCRATAAAVLGDANKVKFINLTPAQRLVAVQSGEVDLSFSQITWTLARESKSGVQFTGTYFFDTYGVMVPNALKVNSTSKLNGASICMITGPGETNAAEYFGKIKVRYKPVPFSEGEQMRKAFLAKRCDAIFHSLSALATFKGTLGAQAADYTLLPETHAREPLAGVVRKGDDRWFDIVRYTLNAMINAEELGVTSQNLKTFASSTDPDIKRLLGTEGDLGPSMGLDKEWATNVIAQVGNYGETFDRAFAASGMPRAQNRLAEKGGLLWAVPMR
ncbi:amino acid ABC transporter substrate-binding protein [Variovorax sp. Sphag1AA]|uniref:amino acid ABC transporter substrate-binding protein n=1 Tax=Variovorax sp. Sphag1AA TaxID=2587027 RepID=UPI00161A9D13|nr:amino acid ABC transporter substrate-binding protein [Variovorax sp. Sphag1AA]MBB3178193.1 general L-amino acid transport system substrate-binding protein [Variovorax sp. Sphag1AA]